MREEYLRVGLPGAPHKQVEMLLHYALPQVDTNTFAHLLIDRFASLRGVLDAETHELEAIIGIGPQTSFFISFIGSVARAYHEPPPVKHGSPLDTPEQAEAFARSRLGLQTRECVLAAFLDAKRRLIHARLTGDAAHSSSRVGNSARVIASLALQYGASSVLIGHNHPGGSPMPSQKDIAEISRIKAALRTVGVGLSDFIIVGEGGEAYSPLRGGLLS